MSRDLEEYRCAIRNRSCRVVSPDWLDRCAEASTRVDETNFVVEEAPEKLPHKSRMLELTLAVNDDQPAEERRDLNATMAQPKKKISSRPKKTQASRVTKEKQLTEIRKTSGGRDVKERNEPTSKNRQTTAEEEAVNAALAALLARKKLAAISENISSGGDQAMTKSAIATSTTTTAATATAAVAVMVTDGRKPPPRLGRATSNLSATTPSSMSQQQARATSPSSAAAMVTENDSNKEATGNEGEGREEESYVRTSQVLSSQQVLYEDPDVRAQRDRVLRKMGASIVDRAGPARAKSTAVARDAGGIGTRTRLRRNIGGGGAI